MGVGADGGGRSRGFTRARLAAACPSRPADLAYVDVHGYRVLRWNPERVEMLEHRRVVGALPDEHVHHRNGDKLDNRPGNLERLTPAAHAAAHRAVTDEALVELYASGLSQVEVGRAVGLHASQVSRRIRAAGADVRPARPHDETIVALHDAGRTSPQIRAALGVSRSTVTVALARNGRRGRPGRPRSGS